MKYKLRQDNIISIGGIEIVYATDTEIKSVNEFNNFICFFTFPKSKDLNWNKIETHQVWKERCLNNPSELFCYNIDGVLRWKFSEQNIVGFGKIDLEALTEEDFITPEHFKNYIQKYNGIELLEVYAGNFRYVLNAETGEIYDKMESR